MQTFCIIFTVKSKLAEAFALVDLSVFLFFLLVCKDLQ